MMNVLAIRLNGKHSKATEMKPQQYVIQHCGEKYPK